MLSGLPSSFGIEKESDNCKFLYDLFIYSGDLTKLKYLDAQKGDRDKKILVAKDLIYNFTYDLEHEFKKDLATVSFPKISENYLSSLNDLLKEFPDLIKDLTDQFQYKYRIIIQLLKLFWKGARRIKNFIVFSHTKFRFCTDFLYYLLKGMILDSILQLEQKDVDLKKIEDLNENLAYLSRLACCLHDPFFDLIFPPDSAGNRDLNNPVLKIKDLFDMYQTRIKDTQRI